MPNGEFKMARRVEEEVTEFPIVTFDSTKPQTVTISLTTSQATIHYRMNVRKGLRLRYRLGRALDPAREPISGS